MLLLHFLRLVRFGNLLVIGVTMCIIQAFIATHGNAHYPGTGDALLRYNFDFNFVLLIFSVVLIAGAGNIINDYFDVKADRVNKPEKMVVDKYIKRRWAIMWNWIFNAIGLSLALYLSWHFSNWWIVAIAFLTINFLWFYSALYKRKIIVGNIIVAVLVGIVPIYVLIYNLPISGFYIDYFDVYIDLGPVFVFEVVVIIAIIAFVINLMREIIKDMADIRGDLHLEAKTVPIALGIRQTKIILIATLIPLLALLAYYVYNVRHFNDMVMTLPNYTNSSETLVFSSLEVFTAFVITSGIFCIISFAILLTSNRRKKYLLASNLLKLAMLFGMVSPLFL